MKTLLRFLQNGKTQFHVAALAKEYLDAHNFLSLIHISEPTRRS